MKYFTNNPDLFTNIIALKLKRKRIRRLKEMSRVLNRTHLPVVNTIQERTFVKRRGIRIEVKGRLTKRYRADRSVYSLR
ncbi:hypothetical protein Glove_1032g8 [Diversispora epigaea]|uniref:Uncharacterized protein n=1 Tax=Diversispora epigaea TaxID=1348612 RepID=A0A397G1Y7_9GLOM|nr:hypothetical protein Glove_1032g8 [Diversispora epigaea]